MAGIHMSKVYKGKETDKDCEALHASLEFLVLQIQELYMRMP